MTTQKVQAKIKTSTIAITVLSILLAVAVASTIVLAAFTANKSATTTITFGGGVTLQVTKTSMDSSAKWIVKSVGTDGTVGNALTDTTSLSGGAQIAAFSVKNTSAKAVAIAFKLEKTGEAVLYASGDTPAETATLTIADTGANYGASGTQSADTGLKGWYVIDTTAANATANLTKAINTVYSAAKLAAVADSATATLTLKITAVYAGDNSTALLTQAITTGNWTAFTTTEVATS